MTTKLPASTPEIREWSSRPQHIADEIKEWIVQQGLQPRDRLPSEQELISKFAMSKGTIREAIRLLEAQGLVKTRTGPGGGAFVNAPSEVRSQALLSNYFYFKNLSINDIYDLREKLEPELAFQLAGSLNKEQIRALEDIMDAYQYPAKTAHEERLQHIASLNFHALLARYAQNHLLGFIIGFLTNVLRELTVHKALYDPENIELWKKGRDYQIALIDAFRKSQPEKAQQIMYEHMCFARREMGTREITLSHQFIPVQD